MNGTERFGIEIETTGLDKRSIALAIASVCGGTVDTWNPSVTMPDGRVWNVVHDGSIVGDETGEIVSPILTAADFDLLQAVVRAVRAAGAKVNYSCGIHVHVDGAKFDARTLTNLVNLVHRREALIERAVGLDNLRRSSYCRPMSDRFVQAVNGRRVRTLEDVKTAWYGQASYRPTKYDQSRYHGLNLNSFFFRGTVEFRYFNGSLHAGEVKTYVQFVLAMARAALTMKTARKWSAARADVVDRERMLAFMGSIGLKGKEFKVARTHMSKNLPARVAAPAVEVAA
jgi:hypothetical protein